jgi:S1-C subfamily serine protease
LDRIVDALAHIQAGEPVSRGTLQTVFKRIPYDELRRLGLRTETEAEVRVRHPEATGMLVVQEVVPGGPADGLLEVGDILISINESRMVSFNPMETLLDDQVGREVSIVVERGGNTIRAMVEVEDLHSITPDRYLETGGGILHPLSYQQARNHAVVVDGLYVAVAGYALAKAGITRGMVITELDGQPVESLEDFETRWASLPTGSRARLRFFNLQNPKVKSLALATVDRLWFPMRHCRRDDATGRWPCKDSPEPPPEQIQTPASTTFGEGLARPVRDLAPSLVLVEFDVPFRIDGLHADRFAGSGLVVDAERGLVVVDRETVPIAMGDVRLVFAASVEVPGQVVYIHPAHNLAVVSYDPVLLGDTPVRAAAFRSKTLKPNDEVWMVGLKSNHERVSQKTRISSIMEPHLPRAVPPRFRETNLEVAQLTDFPPSVGGVLSDRKGRVSALWASFSGGTPPRAFFAAIGAERIQEIVRPLREGRPVGWRTLDVELRRITLAEGRSHGLSEAAARRLAEHDQNRRVLSIKRVTVGTPASQLLEPGDLLLAVDGNPVTTFEEIERAGQQIEPELTLLRNREEKTIRVLTRPLTGQGTDRILFWAGTILQEPYLEVATETGIVPEGVYVTWFSYGSPANRYGVAAMQHIVAVDGQRVTDLDEFLAAIVDRPDRSAVRLRVIGLDGRPDVITLKLDLQFWPTVELRRDGAGWERVLHSPPLALKR